MAGYARMIFQHISDPPAVFLGDNGLLRNVHIIQTGSAIGRFIFKNWSPCVVVHGDNASIIDCHMDCRSTAVMVVL